MQKAQCAPMTEYTMGSKSPIVRKPSQGALQKREPVTGTTPKDISPTRLLMGRIASALQVSEAALYDLPNAVTPSRSAGTAGTLALNHKQDCEALLRAYRRIRDPEERQRLLALVEEVAERT
jgi:hypothetical protein